MISLTAGRPASEASDLLIEGDLITALDPAVSAGDGLTFWTDQRKVEASSDGRLEEAERLTMMRQINSVNAAELSPSTKSCRMKPGEPGGKPSWLHHF
ncbi:hypothetical protein [Bradyrhizobium sp. LTSPM299]|uniref:hypothetical protein n=1 Tax=Bradyrhizobium sp. LTSPM299 TaxID=1619233 RepID=UPI0012E0F115|nr:hypothetical protein [Bradyrhizobium sp. LTSPM299]